MPRKNIIPEDITHAVDRLKGKKVHKTRRAILPGHTDQKPMYDWPSITMSAIAQEAGCARGTLYSLANKNRKKVMSTEEIKLAKRFHRILKPYMRIKKNSTPSKEPKRNTLEYYKLLAKKCAHRLEKHAELRKDMFINKLEFDDIEADNEEKDKIIAELRKSNKEAKQGYLDIKNSNKKLMKENRELRHKLMMCENNLRELRNCAQKNDDYTP